MEQGQEVGIHQICNQGGRIGCRKEKKKSQMKIELVKISTD